MNWQKVKATLLALLWNERGSVSVEQHWVYKFHDAINIQYQQEGSLLENLIDPMMVHRDVRGAIDHHERMGNVIANDVVNPFGPTQILNPPSSKRATTLQSSDAAVLVSDEHTLRSMADPQSSYRNLIVWALGRRADKHVIDNLVGSAQVASVNPSSALITYTSQPMLASRIIGTGIALTLANIITINELLSKASVPRDGRIMLYSPGQLRDIMAITQASSSDFTRNQIHDRGTINGLMWEGLQWIEMADVTDAATATLQTMLPLNSSTNRRTIAFYKGCLGLSIGRPDGPPTIDVRPDLQSRPIQVRQAMMMSAVRVWEGGVVALDVLENL